MPSLDPPETSQADTSALSTSVPANPARSIYAFWSNGGGPSQSIPASAPAKPRKRRKAYSSDTQAKLLGLNGAAWSIGKGEDAAILSGVSEAGLVGGKGRRTGGEEAERKEMAKRARQGAAAVEKAARRIGPLSGEEGPASGSNGISGEASAIPSEY